jgi:hypothetical protein
MKMRVAVCSLVYRKASMGCSVARLIIVHRSLQRNPNLRFPWGRPANNNLYMLNCDLHLVFLKIWLNWALFESVFIHFWYQIFQFIHSFNNSLIGITWF